MKPYDSKIIGSKGNRTRVLISLVQWYSIQFNSTRRNLHLALMHARPVFFLFARSAQLFPPNCSIMWLFTEIYTQNFTIENKPLEGRCFLNDTLCGSSGIRTWHPDLASGPTVGRKLPWYNFLFYFKKEQSSRKLKRERRERSDTQLVCLITVRRKSWKRETVRQNANLCCLGAQRTNVTCERHSWVLSPSGQAYEKGRKNKARKRVQFFFTL